MIRRDSTQLAACKRSCGKVMLLHVYVNLSEDGAIPTGIRHLAPRTRHPSFDQTPFPWKEVTLYPLAPTSSDGHQSWQYASFWNAFMLFLFHCSNRVSMIDFQVYLFYPYSVCDLFVHNRNIFDH